MEVKVIKIVPKTIEYEVIIRLNDNEMAELRTENIYVVPTFQAPITGQLLTKITNPVRS